MGMYTELIFGARLKKETPEEVIEVLKFMLGECEVKPDNFPFGEGRYEFMFKGGSYYFGVQHAVSKMYYDDITESWTLSTRSNIKNYEGEIQIFLDWIKPHIGCGSGGRGMYAIVTYEEGEPELYFLNP